MIAEDDGYAEKDNQAFHQACYQARFGKKCCRCSQVSGDDHGAHNATNLS